MEKVKSQTEENADLTAEKEQKVPGIPFVKNDPRINYAGRPKGSISPITRVKQIFEEDPDKFEEFITEYIKDPANRKHIVEMIDGKAKQALDLGGTLNLNVDPERRAIIEKAIDEVL